MTDWGMIGAALDAQPRPPVKRTQRITRWLARVMRRRSRPEMILTTPFPHGLKAGHRVEFGGQLYRVRRVVSETSYAIRR
jgi:hypothetical protein